MNGDELRPLHLPPAPGWWPPALGWWLLAAALIALLALLVWYFLRRRRRRRWQVPALRELAAIRALGDPSISVQRCSILLRRTLLALYPRAEVAAVGGESWLQRLDQLGKTREYSSGIGRLLLDTPWQPPGNIQPGDCQDLLALVERTLRKADGQ